MPSLVAEIGEAIESHMKMIGMIKEPRLDEHQQKHVDQKRKEFEKRTFSSTKQEEGSSNAFPEGSTLCVKCNTLAMVLMDGCMTCLNCGESKCS